MPTRQESPKRTEHLEGFISYPVGIQSLLEKQSLTTAGFKEK
jgi:hypothetical protein